MWYDKFISTYMSIAIMLKKMAKKSCPRIGDDWYDSPSSIQKR